MEKLNHKNLKARNAKHFENYHVKTVIVVCIFQTLPHCALSFIKLSKAQSNLNQIKLCVVNTEIHYI